MTTYIGWVPTVGRRLSYSIIGSTSHPSLAETANVADDKKRRILCLQERMLLDSALPLFKSALVKLFFGLSGSFIFFLDAECSNGFLCEKQKLEGKLYMFAYKVDKDTDKKVLCLKEAINNLNSFDSNDSCHDLDKFYSKINDKYFDSIQQLSMFQACFRLDRDGLIEIDIETDRKIEHTICAQFFFFIKDISHRHQHHHPKTDTILDIYSKDNPHWQDEIIRALYKKVLDFKRSRNEWVYSSALGVLSYIRAFKKVCAQRKIEIIAGRDDDDLSKSIEISLSELRHITSQKVGFRNVFIATMLALIGAMLMFSSLGTIASPPIGIPSPATSIKYIAGNIINNPFNTLLIVLIISLWVSGYIYKDYCFGRANWFKDVTRLFISCGNQFASGSLMIVISVIIFIAALVII